MFLYPILMWKYISEPFLGWFSKKNVALYCRNEQHNQNNIGSTNGVSLGAELSV